MMLSDVNLEAIFFPTTGKDSCILIIKIKV